MVAILSEARTLDEPSTNQGLVCYIIVTSSSSPFLSWSRSWCS